MLTMRITCTTFLWLLQTLQCLASDDSPFQLTNKATGFCLVKTNNQCNDVLWTTGDRLVVQERNKCLGVQGKSVGSEISLYDCDESDLQKWECKNETVLALKGQELYIELTADNTAVLSKTTGPNNHLTISGTSSGACTRTYKELFTIGGNAAGLPCMFPFMYKDQWYSNCTTFESPEKRFWCAVETKYQNELWGYCPTTSRDDWIKHPITGAYYQLNTQSALTWSQAQESCKQEGASLLSITDPHEQAYITALLQNRGSKLWTGLIVDPEHGWKWINGQPYRYINWDSGHPLPNPGHNCAIVEPAVQHSWQSSLCSKKLGYICYSKAAEKTSTQAIKTSFCSKPWIHYNDHCFYLNRTEKTWSEAQRQCGREGGNLVSIRNVEDHSFVISQLGYASTDELWIGLNDIKTEGLFDWSDHSTVSFTSWEYGSPVVGTDIKDCVLIRGEKGNWADHTCEGKHGFICMKMSDAEPTGEEVVQDLGCKTGWRRHGSYCYFIGSETKTFEDAKDACKSSSSYLADVSTGVDNAFLVSLVGMRPEKYFWLGLSNQKNIDEFVWTNTDSVTFTHWNAEMPGHQQGCVAMKTGVYAGLWDVLPCTNEEKYICKHFADGAIPTPAPPTRVPPKCANEWNKLVSRNYCYKVFSRPSSMRTWFEARDYCIAIGGDLMSIHSAADQQLLRSSYRYRTLWIGLSAPDPATGYVWSDGSPLHFQDWESDEPNNKNKVESCTELQINKIQTTGSWNDVHCEKYLGWVCQIRAGITPNPAPVKVTPDYNKTSDGWLEWNGNQYYFNRRPRAMEDARQFCKQRHGDLVTINSEAESVFLWKQIYQNGPSFWIGLTVDLDRTFGWMDGSPVVHQRWDENQPNFLNNDENCVAMTTSMGFWHDYNCGYEHYSICKRSDSPPVNTTVAPTVRPTGSCPDNWKKFHSKCYSIIQSQKETWDGARSQCQSKGGNLASILSRHVQVFLSMEMTKAPTTNLWIGLHNLHGSSFHWTDGRPVQYNNWGNQLQNRYRRFSSGLDYHFDSIHDEEMELMFHRDEEIFTLRMNACAVMATDPKIGIGKWLKKSCNDTNGYICLRNLDSAAQDSPEPTTPSGYIEIFNDSIKVVTQQLTWHAAKKYCEDDGATLANLRNAWSRMYVELMILNLQAPLWIGLNKQQTGGYFQYIDGWHISSPNWGRSEPSTIGPCVYIDVDGTWKTATCSENKTSVCMKSKDVAPTESSYFPGVCPDDPETRSHRHRLQSSMWTPFKGNCYVFITDMVSWPFASTNCIQHGGSLASIEDSSEQSFIEAKLKIFLDSEESFWIGLYKTHKGLLKWMDKTAVVYSNWDNGEPNYNDYGVIKVSDGTWRTAGHWQNRGYICKARKIPPISPPPTESSSAIVQARGHNILAAVLIISALVTGTVIILFLFKRSGYRPHIPEKLYAFDNPLFSSRTQPDLVDTNKLVANAAEENSGSVITV